VSALGGAVAAARRGAGRVYRSLCNAVDTVLHPRRHRAAVQRLRGQELVRSILVVCHGNICRSPYLAAVLQRALPDVSVSSAGFVGAGRTVPEHSNVLAAQRGLDLAGHRSRLVTRDLLDQTDLLVVMDGRQAQYLTRGFGVSEERIVVAGDLEPRAGETRAIRDPWRESLEVFEESFARLDRCADSLVMQLTKPGE